MVARDRRYVLGRVYIELMGQQESKTEASGTLLLGV